MRISDLEFRRVLFRSRRDQRGSVTVWLALSSFVMIFLVGLAVDLGGQVHAHERAHDVAAQAARAGGEEAEGDRKRVVSGKSVAVRVDLGGGAVIKKKRA